MAARTGKKCRKIGKKDTRQQARTALLASEEKEDKETGKIKAVARDEPTLKYAHTKLSAHCEEKNTEKKKETPAGASSGGGVGGVGGAACDTVTGRDFSLSLPPPPQSVTPPAHMPSIKSRRECVRESGKTSKTLEDLDKEEEEEEVVGLSIRKHTEKYGSRGAQLTSAYVGMREFADKEEEEAAALAYLNQRGERTEGREGESVWGGSLSGRGGAGEARERKKQKGKA